MAKRTSPPVSRTGTDVEQGTPSLFERIGAESVERLVAAFYARVDKDPEIRPLYGKTFTCAMRGLTHFMISWLGGPPTYDVRRARLRRRHAPFAIDARASDAWLANMTAAVQEVGIPAAEARLLLAQLEFGAQALVNTGGPPGHVRFPVGNARFEPRLVDRWNHMMEVEDLLDAISHGDLALLGSMLEKRLLPHAELMSHAFAESLDPLGRVDRRYGRRCKRVTPLEWIMLLLAHRDLDINPADGDERGRFRHLQAMIEAYTAGSRTLAADAPLHAALRTATRDRFLSTIERDRASVRLLGPRGQTLLHDAAMAGEADLAAELIRCGADPDAQEPEGHTPLYYASTGAVARVVLAAGASVDVTSGPTRGTPLHQAARRGYAPVAAALLDHGANIEARDAKGQTPLRRAVNCRQLAVVQLLMQRGADPRAEDNRRVTPLDVARTTEMKQALAVGLSDGTH
jgi:truncated hemoglobin YjbI